MSTTCILSASATVQVVHMQVHPLNSYKNTMEKCITNTDITKVNNCNKIYYKSE